MNRRSFLRLGVPLVGASASLIAACDSELEPRTASEYEAYISTARSQIVAPLASLANLGSTGEPSLWNLNEKRPDGVMSVYHGVVLHWAGAIRLTLPSTAVFQHLLTSYDRYTRWYAPFIYSARGMELPHGSEGRQRYSVVSILHDVFEKPAPFIPDQHFAFEVTSLAEFQPLDATLVVSNHAEKVRESATGNPELSDSRNRNNDLLRPDYGHGVLWRSDTFWRATAIDDVSLYAEYHSISLSRSLDAISATSPCVILRLPGIRNKAIQAMTSRPRRVVATVLKQTRAAAAQFTS